MTRTELDMTVMGQLSAFLNCSENTANSEIHRHATEARKRPYQVFWHRGQRVCRNTFLFLHTISKKRLRNLKAAFLEHGLAPRMHGNIKRLPANTLSLADTQRIAQFLTSYAEANAILLPGRIPGYKSTDIQLLPSCTTKRQVWLQYCSSLSDVPDVHRTVAYSTFCALWKRVLPRIIVTKPMSDLCLVCQRNNVAIQRAVNRTEDEKSEVRVNTS